MVLYGTETWPLVLREAVNIGDVFNRVLRIIVVFKRAGENCHEKHRNVYFPPNISVVLCGLYAYRILVGKPDGKRSLRRPRCRWKNNISIYFKGMRFECLVCVQHDHDRVQWRAVANTMTNRSVP